MDRIRSDVAWRPCGSGAVQWFAAGVARQRQPQGMLVRTWSTRGMALWVMVMLLVYLVIYYAR